MRYGRICPILSINSYLDCKKAECQLWLDDYNECAVKFSAVDRTANFQRLIEAVRAIADGVSYSPTADIPSISESAVKAADALKTIAQGMANE